LVTETRIGWLARSTFDLFAIVTRIVHTTVQFARSDWELSWLSDWAPRAPAARRRGGWRAYNRPTAATAPTAQAELLRYD
jgi:hypothetical protein